MNWYSRFLYIANPVHMHDCIRERQIDVGLCVGSQVSQRIRVPKFGPKRELYLSLHFLICVVRFGMAF